MSDPPTERTADGWSGYHTATRGCPPRPLLVRALALGDAPGNALDLGCGAGNDTRYLLDRGCCVTAVDASPSAISPLKALAHPQLEAIEGTFAAFPVDPAGYDLITAQYALPFNPPETFEAMFARLLAALRPGGLFTGNLFGTRDAWNVPGSGMTFHTRAQVESLLQDLATIELREIEDTVKLASGEDHAAHAFDIIARKPLATP